MLRSLVSPDVETIRSSYRRLSPRGEEIARHFYATLFVRHPEVRPLFEGVDMEQQHKKLMRALALVVRHLEQPDFLRAYLQGLGAIHVAYGVSNEQYRGVCACLLDALAYAGGDAWTPEEDAAWQAALETISETMVAGAAKLAATG
jgi:hemoglobin-like flavoprotein